MFRIGQLAIACSSLTPRHTCVEALDYFSSNPGYDILPIVSDDRPVGLITRHVLLERFSRPFQHELFGNKSCSLFMDKKPLLVDEDDSITTVGAVAASDSRRALQDGVIVTIQGKYSGTCSGPTIMQVLADMQVERSRQVLEGVRYASRIQRAFLHTSNENLAEHLPQHQIFWEPRDMVGGDYYFCRGDQDRCLRGRARLHRSRRSRGVDDHDHVRESRSLDCRGGFLGPERTARQYQSTRPCGAGAAAPCAAGRARAAKVPTMEWTRRSC